MATVTVKLHRILRATTERVYLEFIGPDAMAKWLSPISVSATWTVTTMLTYLSIPLVPWLALTLSGLA